MGTKMNKKLQITLYSILVLSVLLFTSFAYAQTQDFAPTYSAGEPPTVTIQKTLPAQLAGKVAGIFGREDMYHIKVLTPENEVVAELAVDANSSLTSSVPTENLSPGKYTVEVLSEKSGETTTQNFFWGVLALNTNKPTYTTNDTTAHIAIAVLDDIGAMVCDAKVDLEISAPGLFGKTTTLSTDNDTIKVNDVCQSKDFTLTPDYETTYTLAGVGTYNLTLTAQTQTGTHTITDQFELKEHNEVKFDIGRETATRIFPPLNYPVKIFVTPRTDFAGQVIEYVPADYAIALDTTYTVEPPTEQTPHKKIIWQVDWKAGEQHELYYVYNAPDYSPAFDLLGKLEFVPANQTNQSSDFTEARNWQIAVDDYIGDPPDAYWKLDEEYGTTLYDSSGNGNNATASGASRQANETCVTGKCLFFDGSNDVGTVSLTYSVDTGVSFSAWVRASSDGEGGVGEIFEKGTSTFLRTDSLGDDGLADLQASLDLVTTTATLNVADAILTDKWHHITLTYADDGDDEITLYVDGIAVGTSTNGSGALDIAASDSFLIGGDTSSNYHGYIDEFKIYPYERTEIQVKADFISMSGETGASASFAPVFDNFTEGIMGHWKMDELSGDTCAGSLDSCDSSGNSVHGTWNGNATFDATGKYGPGTTFDGTGDYIDLGDINL